MATNFPVSLDTTTNIPNTRTSGQVIPASDHNDVVSALIAVETKLGAGAATLGTIGQVLTVTAAGATGFVTPSTSGAPNATTAVAGLVQLAGDLTGTYTAPSVAKLSGIAISGAPSVGQALAATSGSAAAWSTLTPGNLAKRITVIAYTATITPNSSTTDIARIILAGTTVLAAPSGTPTDGQILEVHLVQDGTGSRTVTYGTGYKFATSLAAPTLSTLANTTDVLVFRYSSNVSLWRFYGAITGF